MLNDVSPSRLGVRGASIKASQNEGSPQTGKVLMPVVWVTFRGDAYAFSATSPTPK
jgi:hypothetical protein